MDKSKDPIGDIEKCKGLFVKYFPKCKILNLNNNTFIPLSTYQLENELLMDKSFKNLIYYHYFNYATKIIREKNRISSKSFIDHLYEILTRIHLISKDNIIKDVEEFNNNANISKINDEIISIINNLKNFFPFDEQIIIGISEENFKESTNSFFDEDDEINPSYIIKMMYILQNKKKILPSYSNDTNKLLEFFSIKNKNKNKKEKEKENTLDDETEKGDMMINKKIINI